MTRRCCRAAIQSLVIATAVTLCAQQKLPANGTIFERQPLHLTASYEEWLHRAYDPARVEAPDPTSDMNRVRSYNTAARYDALNDGGDVRVERIVYSSDGLRIRGFLVQPTSHANKLPVIVWCHGGAGEVGRIYTDELIRMSVWARAGFIVLASQYRGNGGSEGKDEQGGADIHDVNALAATAAQLSEADPQNIFLYGQSRGGMMVYEALRAGFPARAAVVNSGVSNAGAFTERPDAKEMEQIARAGIPDFDREKRSGFRSRSAIYWVAELHTPILLLHGTADWRVSPMQSLRMAEALQQAGKPYSLHLFEAGTHVELSGDTVAIDAEILSFFRSHLTR